MATTYTWTVRTRGAASGDSEAADPPFSVTVTAAASSDSLTADGITTGAAVFTAPLIDAFNVDILSAISVSSPAAVLGAPSTTSFAGSTPPTLVSPADQATVNGGLPHTFSWSFQSDGTTTQTKYEFQRIKLDGSVIQWWDGSRWADTQVIIESTLEQVDFPSLSWVQFYGVRAAPNTGSEVGGTNVEIKGRKFDTSAATTVSIGGVSATNVVVASPGTITLTTGAHTPGSADIVITQDGQSYTLTNGFTYIEEPVYLSHTFDEPDSFFGSERLGYQFTVGGQSVDVNMFEYHAFSIGEDENIRIHRVSDGALMAEATITPAKLREWDRVSIPQITLAANTDYTISHRASGASRNVTRNSTNIVYDTRITFVGARYGTTDGLPTTESSQEYVAARFGLV